MPDKYKIVFEQTADFDRAKGLSVTESALGGMATPAGRHRRRQRRHDARRARGAQGPQPHRQGGADRLRRAARGARRRSSDGSLTATIEQIPGGQSRGAVDALVAFLRDGTKPANQVTLLTPIAITKDNLNEAERLGEVK